MSYFQDPFDLRDILASPLFCKVITYFHNHPALVDTVESIASSLGVRVEEVELVVDILAKAKILEDRGELWGPIPYVRNAKFYSYTSDNQLRERIGKWLREVERYGHNYRLQATG